MREALLDIAVEHFSRCGFEGAATRAIAAECCTAMSSITYHFGGKEGLYLAAAEHIARQIAAEHAATLAAAPASPVTTPQQAVERLVILLDLFAGTMLSERSAKWARFITREQHEPTQAFARIHEIAMRPMMELGLELVARARPDLSESERRATAFLLFGEVIALRAGRASLCRMLDIDTPGPAEEALLRTRLAAHVRAILSAPPETAR